MTDFTPLTTTLNRIKAIHPCPEGWSNGLEAAGKTKPDDEPIRFSDMAREIPFSNVMYCCRAEPDYYWFWRRIGLYMIEKLEPLIVEHYPPLAGHLICAYSNYVHTGQNPCQSLRDSTIDDYLKARKSFYVANQQIPDGQLSLFLLSALKHAVYADPAEGYDAGASLFWLYGDFHRICRTYRLKLFRPEPQLKSAFIQLCDTGRLA
jgi:hypothetical protein